MNSKSNMPSLLLSAFFLCGSQTLPDSVSFAQDVDIQPLTQFKTIPYIDDHIVSLKRQVHGVSFNDDASKVAIGYKGGILTYDTRNGSRLWRHRERGAVPSTQVTVNVLNSLAVSFQTPKKSQIQFLDWETGELQNVLNLRSEKVDSLSFSARGMELFLGSNDGAMTPFSVTRFLKTDSPVHLHQETITSLRHAHSGRFVITASADGQAIVWDKERKKSKVIMSSKSAIQGLAISTFRQDSKVALGQENGEITIYDYKKRKLIRKWKESAGSVKQLVFHPNAKNLLFGICGQELMMWDTNTGERLNTLPTANGITGFTLSDEGDKIATISTLNQIQIWEKGITVKARAAPTDALPAKTFVSFPGKRSSTASAVRR